MARMRISEVIKNYDVEKSELASFLAGHGIDVKTADSLNEEEVKLVEGRYGKKSAAAKTARPSAKEDAAKDAAAETAADGKKVVRKVATPVKKKKIIIVTGGNGGSKQHSMGGYSAGGQGRTGQTASGSAGKPARASQSASQQTAYRPIKPKTAPSQMSVDYHKPAERPAQSSAETRAAAAVQGNTAEKLQRMQGEQNVSEEQSARKAQAVKPAAERSAKAAVKAPEAPRTAGVSDSAGALNANASGTANTANASNASNAAGASAMHGESSAKTAAEDRHGKAASGAEAADVRTASDREKASGMQASARQESAGAEARTAAAAADAVKTAAEPQRKTAESKTADSGQSEDRKTGRTQEKPQDRRAKTQEKAPAQKEKRISSISDGIPTIIIHKHYDGYGSSANNNRNGQGSSTGRTGQRSGYGQGQGGSGQNRRPAGAGDRGGFRGSYAGGQGGQGDRRGQGRPGSFGGNSGRPGQGNRTGAPGRGFGGSSSGASAASDFAAGTGSKRRNSAGGGRDRHNKKDVAFEQNEKRENRNRSGRFIKPVVEKAEAPEEQIKVITIPEKLTIGDLAEAMHLKAAELIKKLFLAGKMMTVNSEVTYEEAENIAADYEILCEKEEKVDVIQELLKEDEDLEENLVTRAPVVCVMGHVDHGKTSILDYIRHSRVTEKEAGGITQAIGAYTVSVQDRTITFLDTPGHEAFTAMRLRGAQSTDIAVLVVAADDGVMPQTVEAINHAKAAGVEIIVAVNKMDKADANPDKVKEQLSKYELIPAAWGGQTEFVPVSAKTGEGIDELLDTILLQADVMELKANPDRLARGLVLEAKLDRGRGPVANVLVQKGTLHVGDFISAGPAFGKVRAMINDKGKNVKEAGPSEPVVVLGLSDVPGAGEVIVAHPNNDEAKAYAQTYKAQHKEELVEENVMSMNVEDLFDQMREGKMKELELIVKADVQGSVEALCGSLQKLSNDEVKVRIIHSAAGNITESDVDLAAASNAAIIGFNVHPDSTAKSIAEHNGVSIHLYKVIYQAIDDVNAALNGMLAPVYEERVIGHAEVRQLFKSGKIGNIAGSMVLDGQIEKGCTVRITRDGEKIFEGALASLKRFKDDVKEVKAGYDCGLVFADFDAMNVGDQIEAYKMVEVPREEVIARKEKEAARKAKENA